MPASTKRFREVGRTTLGRVADAFAAIVMVFSLVGGARAFVPLALPGLVAAIWLGYRLRGLREATFGTTGSARWLPLTEGLLLAGVAWVVWSAVIPDSSDDAWLALGVPTALMFAIGIFLLVAGALPPGRHRDSATLAAMLMAATASVVIELYLVSWAVTSHDKDAFGHPLRSRVQLAVVLYLATITAGSILLVWARRMRDGRSQGTL